MNEFSQFTMLDLVVILLYLAGMMYIGVHFIKRVKQPGDFYVAGRSLGSFALTATVCASIIGGSAMIGRGGITYEGGIRGIIVALPYLLGMFVFAVFAGRIQKVGRKYDFSSIPDLMAYRYGKAVKYIIALLVGWTMMATVSAQIVATSTILRMIGGNVGITYVSGAIISTVIFFAYTAASGLFGVVYTDIAQFFMLVIFVYILLPIRSVSVVGGMQTLFSSVPPEMLKPVFDGELIGMVITNLVMTMAGAEYWQRAFAAKSVKAATRGQFWGTAVYAGTIVTSLLLGLSARVLFPNIVQEFGTADAAIPALAIRLLPAGLTGLVLSGMLAVMMSSADTCLLVATQTVVRDVWKTHKPDLAPQAEIKLSRILTGVIAIGALVIALFFQNAYDTLMFAWTFYAAAVGLPAIAALYWKKATAPGVLAGIGAGFVVSVGWKIIGSPWGVGSVIPGTIACGLALVIVSLATYAKRPAPMPVVEKKAASTAS